jgi:hypothetical protein
MRLTCCFYAEIAKLPNSTHNLAGTSAKGGKAFPNRHAELVSASMTRHEWLKGCAMDPTLKQVQGDDTAYVWEEVDSSLSVRRHNTAIAAATPGQGFHELVSGKEDDV